MDDTEAFRRLVADCLGHLPDYGFEPYRYGSGENKSVIMTDDGVAVIGAGGQVWHVAINKGLLRYNPNTLKEASNSDLRNE